MDMICSCIKDILALFHLRKPNIYEPSLEIEEEGLNHQEDLSLQDHIQQ